MSGYTPDAFNGCVPDAFDGYTPDAAANAVAADVAMGGVLLSGDQAEPFAANAPAWKIDAPPLSKAGSIFLFLDQGIDGAFCSLAPMPARPRIGIPRFLSMTNPPRLPTMRSSTRPMVTDSAIFGVPLPPAGSVGGAVWSAAVMAC